MNKIHMYKEDVEVGGLSSGDTTTSRRMYCGIEWPIHWPGQDGHMTQDMYVADCKTCLSSLAKERGAKTGYTREELEKKYG